MSGIFISYRRIDTAGHAGRLCDRLRAHFGRQNVFMDLDTIPPGRDFVTAIEEAVGSCDALVALIGRDWLPATNAAGGRRIDDPEDSVRVEIASALRRSTLVIPVLVEGATMPSSRDLPEDVARLARHNALEASDGRWDYDMDRLIQALENVIAGAPGAAPPPPPAGSPPGAPPVAYALDQILPGMWNFELQHPVMGLGQGTMALDANGYFQGQVAGPLGTWAVTGQWQLVGPAQVQMLGMQTNGMQTMPYQVLVQFASVTPDQLAGATAAGENVLFVRVR